MYVLFEVTGIVVQRHIMKNGYFYLFNRLLFDVMAIEVQIA